MTSRLLLTLIGLLLVGCSSHTDPVVLDELDVVALDEDEGSVPEPVRYELAVSPQSSAAGEGAVELWLPLPGDAPGQTVSSLLWEVDPPARVEDTTTADGERVLHVRADGAFPVVRLRAQIERRPVEADLPGAVAGISKGLAPPGWVQAAGEAGLSARVAYGIVLDREGVSACSFPEVRVGGEWIPVDRPTSRPGLSADRVRISSLRLRATLDGEPIPSTTRWELALIE